MIAQVANNKPTRPKTSKHGPPLAYDTKNLPGPITSGTPALQAKWPHFFFS